jgi:DNA modification methylase
MISLDAACPSVTIAKSGDLPDEGSMSHISQIAVPPAEPAFSWAPTPTSILLGDAATRLADIESGVVQTCVTSPPYWGLRDYGEDAQIGRESTPEEYVACLVTVFREVRRTLRDDGTLWVNIGDSYAGQAGGGGCPGLLADHAASVLGIRRTPAKRGPGLKRKDLIGIPWMLAFALRADGWWLRDEIVWHKLNPTPESVRDRCTSAHEKVFLLSKRPIYFFDGDAIAEPCANPTRRRSDIVGGNKGAATRHGGGAPYEGGETRRWRNVWSLPKEPFHGDHYAVMPSALAERCVRATSRPGDLVLDPFLGAGTTALASNRLGRVAVGCEISTPYIDVARERLAAAGFEAEVY